MTHLKQQIRSLLDRAEPEDIWRPIVDDQGALLAAGHEDMRDGSPDDLTSVDFSGKRVLDLGCNYGYYSFLAKRFGAESVVGIDIDSNGIAGCRLLARLYDFKNMDFQCSDFTRLTLNERFDCILLINFIGKRSVCKGIKQVLATVRTHARGEIILSARLEYDIVRNLQDLPERLVDLYGRQYVRENRLYLSRFLHDFFSDRWRMSIISPDYADKTLKRTFLFTPYSGTEKPV